MSSPPVACTTFADVCRRNAKQKSTGKDTMQKKVGRFKKSVLIRPIPATHANLVVLATVVVLPIVGVLPTIAGFTTAPVFHGYDSIAGIRLGVVRATTR